MRNNSIFISHFRNTFFSALCCYLVMKQIPIWPRVKENFMRTWKVCVWSKFKFQKEKQQKIENWESFSDSFIANKRKSQMILLIHWVGLPMQVLFFTYITENIQTCVTRNSICFQKYSVSDIDITVFLSVEPLTSRIS